MTYCKDCVNFSDKPKNSPFGKWAGTCVLLKIGRDGLSDKCLRDCNRESLLDS